MAVLSVFIIILNVLFIQNTHSSLRRRFFSGFTQWELTFLASAAHVYQAPQFHSFKRDLPRQSARPWETVAGHTWPVPLRPPQHRGHLPGEWMQIPPAQGRRFWCKEERVPPSERSPSRQDGAHFLRGAWLPGRTGGMLCPWFHCAQTDISSAAQGQPSALTGAHGPCGS